MSMITSNLLSSFHKLARNWQLFAVSACLLAVLLGVSGCVNVNVGGLEPKPDETRFYTLGQTTAAAQGLVNGQFVIGIREVSLAEHLDSPQMALRQSDFEYRYVADHRWISALHSAVGRQLCSRLSRHADVLEASMTPWPDGFDASHVVYVHIVACEGDAAGKARFIAEWVISAAGGDKESRFRGETRVIKDWDKGDYAALAESLAQGIDQLSMDILAAVGGHSR